MKLAVIGSRNFTLEARGFKALDQLYDKITMIISGGARGADSLGQKWAQSRGFPCLIHYPRWTTREGLQDKTAGFRRNKDIINDCDAVLAFWDGKSNGTKDSIKYADALEKPITIAFFEKNKITEVKFLNGFIWPNKS